ncbi:MAG: serine hydrolase [Candidatus Lernaella stagnicola]|nr:serine hydrolase [Candidatus Lernaella stagnicola]
MNRRLLWALFGLVFLFVGVSALFGGEGDEAAIRAFFTDDKPDYEALFATRFLNAIPIRKMEEVRLEYLTALGDLREIVPQKKKYGLVFAKGKTVCSITLDAEGKIIGFWIGPMTLAGDTVEKVLADLKALEYEVSLSVLRNGSEEVVAVNSDRPLAVGSSFKLYVLEALEKKMRKEGLGWDTVVHLNEDHFSLPSGFLQNWPAGTPVTLRTLANLMISISDNTAADHLLFYVGRDAVEATAPERVRPFYSTAEMFRLKFGVEPEARERSLAADLTAKRKMLADFSKIPRENLKFKSEPLFIDTFEWLITTRELGATIYRLRDNPSIYINAGTATKKDWLAAGFKGGSESGVLNLTQLLRKDEQSPWLSISVTVNNPENQVNHDAVESIVIRLINLAHAGTFN